MLWQYVSVCGIIPLYAVGRGTGKMLAVERRKRILAALRSEKRVQVGEMSRLFGVSEETIRRDLERMEADGLASRTYGGAVLRESDREDTPYDIRMRAEVEGKEKIARVVASLVADGEYIILDESSTSYYVARALKNRKNLTVITNSMEIIREVAGVQGWTVLCTGGALRSSAPSFSGHQAESMVRSYHVDKAILSCGSLDILAGFTDRHEDTALVKRAMMSAARQVILAADHGKFDKIAFAKIGELSQLNTIVTDKAPDARWADALASLGVKLLYENQEE